jgi:Putative transposase
VLHTWGQNLHIHPHVHCVVPGGGISKDGSRWIACRKSFFLPVKVLGRLFRRKFLIYLGKAFQKVKLGFHGELEPLAKPAAFATFCRRAGQREWVVYAKRPFGGPELVLKYLAATHTGWPSPTAVSYHWKMAESPSIGKIMPTVTRVKR